jgi:ECF transporter S component (folate family)
MFKSSFKEFFNTRNFVTMAMLCAMNVVLSWFSVRLTSTLKIGFSYLTMGLLGHWFGPVCAGLLGLVLDSVKWLIRPDGPYLILFGVTELLAGVIYGVMLYHQKVTLVRCFLTKFLINALLNVLLTPAWLTILYGGSYWAYVAARIVKNLILWPIESVILYFLLTRLDQATKRA